MIERFDIDNPALISEWPRERKVAYVENWNNVPKRPNNES